MEIYIDVYVRLKYRQSSLRTADVLLCVCFTDGRVIGFRSASSYYSVILQNDVNHFLCRRQRVKCRDLSGAVTLQRRFKLQLNPRIMTVELDRLAGTTEDQIRESAFVQLIRLRIMRLNGKIIIIIIMLRRCA